VRALGTSVYRPVDVRIIAATNRDLRGEVNQGASAPTCSSACRSCAS
jgi:transcriptional regulator with GAF, ATPase, and Fis domain